ncbi:MAG: iron-sulfur cluster assembly accessory protein [Proteobacteria bacterium]|nr:iron-sulfur cluster assembly accessory protein [Pseudomonadota bacterium]
MSVTLTECAAQRVKQILARTPGSIGLRVAVTESGCSGFSYLLDTDDTFGDNDQVFSSFGVDVLVDIQSLDLVKGTEIDYVSEGLNQTFKFSNPRATGECGCGESFAISE